MIAARAVGATLPLLNSEPPIGRRRGRGAAPPEENLEPTDDEVEAAFARSALAVPLRHVPRATVVPGSARRPVDRVPVLAKSLA